MSLFKGFGLRWDYVIVLLFVAYGMRVYRQYARLKVFKGPFGSGVSIWWMFNAIRKQAAHLEYSAVNEKYGPIARIGPTTLLTNSPDVIFHINNARSAWTRSEWFQGSRMQPGQDHILSFVDDEKHAKRRAQTAPALNGKEVPTLEADIDELIHNLLNLIRKKYVSTRSSFKPMDFAQKASFLTLDVVTRLAFGKELGNLENDKDMNGYLGQAESMLYSMNLALTVPLLRIPFQYKWIGELVYPSDQDSEGMGFIVGLAKRMVKQRFEPGAKDRQDIQGSMKKQGLSDDELVSEALLQILAGTDTTAASIRAGMLFVMSNAQVYRKLQEEIDEAVRSGKASRPIVKASEARDLPYLQAVIRETLRMWTPAPAINPKKCPPGGDSIEVDGKRVFIPGGTEIGQNGWSILRSKETFGEDANLFRPERWFEGGESAARRTKVSELVWSSGKHQCLGRTIAKAELSKVFFELLHEFNFSSVDPTHPWYLRNVAVWVQRHMWVRITDRETQEDSVDKVNHAQDEVTL